MGSGCGGCGGWGVTCWIGKRVMGATRTTTRPTLTTRWPSLRPPSGAPPRQIWISREGRPKVKVEEAGWGVQGQGLGQVARWVSGTWRRRRWRGCPRRSRRAPPRPPCPLSSAASCCWIPSFARSPSFPPPRPRFVAFASAAQADTAAALGLGYANEADGEGYQPIKGAQGEKSHLFHPYFPWPGGNPKSARVIDSRAALFRPQLTARFIFTFLSFLCSVSIRSQAPPPAPPRGKPHPSPSPPIPPRAPRG